MDLQQIADRPEIEEDAAIDHTQTGGLFPRQMHTLVRKRGV